MNIKTAVGGADPASPPFGQASLERGFDWGLVRSFLAVIDTGSLLAASRRLGVAQPTIGRHVEALESQLGKALFERTGRGLTPTADALEISRHARQMQAGAEQLLQAVVGSDRQRGGLVRITASRTVAQFLLPEMVARLQVESPEIDVAVVASDEVSNLLRRDADIAIRMVRPEQASLVARRLGEVRILPCASLRYLDRYGTPRRMADLLGHRLIGPDRDPGFARQMQGLAMQLGVAPDSIRVGVRSDDFATQFAAIRAGLGAGFATDYMIRRHPDVVALPFDLPVPGLPVWLAVHREVRSNPRIRTVFDALARSLKKALEG